MSKEKRNPRSKSRHPSRTGPSRRPESGPPGFRRRPATRGRPPVGRAGARRGRPVDTESDEDGLMRINKILASAGLGSRRQVEELILQGRVEVDGQVINSLATRVDWPSSRIKIDGELLKQPKLVYYALNKPKGVLSTNRDPSGRRRVIDYVPDHQRVFSVGRLDQHSEGLMLLTNDGSLAQRLAHPRFRVQKTYFVVVAGVMTREELDRLRKGVYLAEGVARIDGATIRKARKTSTEIEIQLSEGKNREIRRILAREGHKVVVLRRIAIGPLRLGELPVGAARELTPHEVRALYACTERKPPGKAKSPEKPRPAKPAVAFSTPLESPTSEDFGLGLDEDYSLEGPALLNPGSDDAIDDGSAVVIGGGADVGGFTFDNDAQWDEDSDDQWDDDFAIDLSSGNPSGTILGFDEDQPAQTDRPQRRGKPNQGRPRGGTSQGGKGRSRSSGTSGQGKERGQAQGRDGKSRKSGVRTSKTGKPASRASSGQAGTGGGVSSRLGRSGRAAPQKGAGGSRSGSGGGSQRRLSGIRTKSPGGRAPTKKHQGRPKRSR